MKTCNKCAESKLNIAYGNYKSSSDGLYPTCKVCVKISNKIYYKLKKEEIKTQHKTYYKNNKSTINYKYNKYYEKNKTTITEACKLYRQANPIKVKKSHKLYQKTNKEFIKARARLNRTERLLKDPLFKFKETVRGCLKSSFKRRMIRKNSKTAQILGCSYKKLYSHLRLSFESNYGIPFSHIDVKLLHIDHIIPISIAKTEADILKLNHYSNLQYLFSWDNLEKGDKI